MTRITLCTAITVLTFSATTALACTPEDVQARQGALLEAVQALLATNPQKAQEIVVQMQTELEVAQATGDEAAVCDMMDRLTAEAREG